MSELPERRGDDGSLSDEALTTDVDVGKVTSDDALRLNNGLSKIHTQFISGVALKLSIIIYNAPKCPIYKYLHSFLLCMLLGQILFFDGFSHNGLLRIGTAFCARDAAGNVPFR